MRAEFSIKVAGRYKSCLERQVNKAVRVEECQADILMNSKAEFHHAPLVRVVTSTYYKRNR